MGYGPEHSNTNGKLKIRFSLKRKQSSIVKFGTKDPLNSPVRITRLSENEWLIETSPPDPATGERRDVARLDQSNSSGLQTTGYYHMPFVMYVTEDPEANPR